MVVFLPQLHAFLNEIGPRLPPDDLHEITTGIAYIIQPMQPSEGINALSLFAHPILEQVVRLSTSPQLESGQLRIMAGRRVPGRRICGVCGDSAETNFLRIADALERLCALLGICMDFSAALPAECANTASEAWKMLDGVLSRHGNVRSICDVTCNLLRVGVDFFHELARPLAPVIISRLTQAWQLTNLSSYIWATSKMIRFVQQPTSADPVYGAIEQAFDQQSQHLFQFFAGNPMAQHEDGTHSG